MISSGNNGTTLANPKIGQDQVSGGEVLCWLTATVANAL